MRARLAVNLDCSLTTWQYLEKKCYTENMSACAPCPFIHTDQRMRHWVFRACSHARACVCDNRGSGIKKTTP